MITITQSKTNRPTFLHVKNGVKKVKKGLRHGLIEIGRDNKKHLKTMIKTPPHRGRFYGKHQASAPGEAPANWTGKLMKSVVYKSHGSDSMDFGEEAPHGLFLEDGTKNADNTERMAARPHVGRTVKEKSKDNYNSLEGAVDRAIKK